MRPGDRVLDLGCGTATLTILIQQAVPGAEAYGIGGDAKVLAIACSRVPDNPSVADRHADASTLVHSNDGVG